MAQSIDHTEPGKVLLFIAGISVVLAAVGRYVLQPLLATWLFFTLKHDKERVRGLIVEVFRDDIAELVKSAAEIRECQAEHGAQLADIAGYLRGRAE